jgi:hypothetical protein
MIAAGNRRFIANWLPQSCALLLKYPKALLLPWVPLESNLWNEPGELISQGRELQQKDAERNFEFAPNAFMRSNRACKSSLTARRKASSEKVPKVFPKLGVNDERRKLTG